MCGIICFNGTRLAAPLLLEGLNRLAYRGYDSSGIATLVGQQIHKRRAEGKISNLIKKIKEQPLSGTLGIAHTRWATHGAPNEVNAHPHANSKVAIVHNGIIENYRELSSELISRGHVFETETDSEVILHLLSDLLDKGITPEEAVKEIMPKLTGAFALGILFAVNKTLIGVKRGSPLAIGYGDNEIFLGSDAVGLSPFTGKITYLEEGDWVVLNQSKVKIYNSLGKEIKRPIVTTALSGQAVEKGGFRHFMHKEIHEQPTMIGNSLNSFLNSQTREICLPQLKTDLSKINRITMVACGTSSFACRIARYWLEKYAKIPVSVDIGSEYRYRPLLPSKDELALFVSQSGETRDTMASLEIAKENGINTMGLINVAESSIARNSDDILTTMAGPEIGVASTKAFTTQLITLAALTIELARLRNTISKEEELNLSNSLLELPAAIASILSEEESIKQIAMVIQDSKDVLYIGRGTSHGVALEGALKLKEISYLHAEAYAAGELKHGPIALIDEGVPIIGIVPTDELFDKTLSNLEEAASRGGTIIAITDNKAPNTIDRIVKHRITLPFISVLAQPILYTIPVQLIAYHTAVIKGTDVDQPRNLAKSVTVE